MPRKAKKDRVIAYVDGFNLYFGMKEKGWKRYYWLNIKTLVQNLLKSDQRLIRVKYFTSRVSSTRMDPQKHKRQNTYLEALMTVKKMEIHYGHYLDNPITCFRCGNRWIDHDEKMTDVNIATHLMLDAFDNKYDTSLLISGDSDLCGTVNAIKHRFKRKRIIVAFPPARYSEALANVANASLTIGRKKIADSQFSKDVSKADGFVLTRPTSWK